MSAVSMPAQPRSKVRPIPLILFHTTLLLAITPGPLVRTISEAERLYGSLAEQLAGLIMLSMKVIGQPFSLHHLFLLGGTQTQHCLWQWFVHLFRFR